MYGSVGKLTVRLSGGGLPEPRLGRRLMARFVVRLGGSVREMVPARQSSDPSPAPVIVLVLAGIVLLAVLPPVQRIHVRHRSYQRSDWI
jgi:hypothetical protein